MQKYCLYIFWQLIFTYNQMDIQIQTTPPKRSRVFLEPCTPPKGSTPQQFYNTPTKVKTPMRMLEETPIKGSTNTPIKAQNPESKRPKQFGTNRKTPKTPGSSNRNITEFNVSRLDQDYIFQRKIGEGNFSSVGLYRSRMTGDYFAIKSTKLSSMSVNEAQALATLSIVNQRSKNIIRYYHSWVQSSELFLVMQHCNTNLASVYNKNRGDLKKFEQTYIKDVFKQSLQGLKCMHQNQMVHLDIKPDNLLFKDSVLKVSDLGLTRITKIKREGDLEEGDSRYIARELLNYHSGMDLTKADIFSLAITIYEGITLQVMPNNGQQWMNVRQNGLQLKDRMDLQDYSQELLQILEMMTKPNPKQRPSAHEILRMHYFKESLTRRSRILMGNNPLMNSKIEKQRQRKKEGSV